MQTLTQEQQTHFGEEGYLLIRNLLNPEKDIHPVFTDDPVCA